MSWQRARSEAQKAERIKSIEMAAATLFLERPYREVSLGQIASLTGFTRPNLYRYFSSKEEIFLSLLGGDLDAWLADLGEHDEANQTIQSFARFWVDTFLQQPRLPQLLPLLSTSLEENIGEEDLRRFKRRLREQADGIGEVVLRRLPWFDPKMIGEFVMANMAMVTGFMPMATRGEVHERVLEQPELRVFAIEFRESYQNSLIYWLRGVYEIARKGAQHE